MTSDSPTFLSLEQILELHAQSLAQFGGIDGIREPGLLESALASAEATFWYGRGDLFEIAATYAFHIAKSQAFLDGNKRTAITAALVFLRTNGQTCPRNTERLYRAMIDIANKQMNKAGLAQLFREMSHEDLR